LTYGTKRKTNMPKRIPDIERRLKKLEKMSHPPVEWGTKIETHERAIQDLYDRINEIANKLGDIV